MFKKIIFITIICIFITIKTSYANIVKDIKITGNDRISNETVILFGDIKKNSELDNDDLNEILKKLYDTSFFKSISINIKNNILYIDVIENPLIQTVIFDGIKNKGIIQNLKEIILQKEKSSYLESKIKEDQNRIINSLRINGYYFSKVEAKVKRNDNNTVDIIYDISLGEKALIRKIKFIGNKIFKDNKLRKVIVSEEDKFWKFLSTKKNIDIQRFSLDENLLKNFYKNNGYYNVKINSSFAQIIEEKYFEVIYNIDAGNKYFFNSLKLNIPIDYNEDDFTDLQNLLLGFKGKPFALNKIEEILDEIDEIALSNSYDFVSATYDEIIVNNNKIDLIINLKDTEKFYINKINITGNSITSERVIRNSFLADEGDPYNEILVNKSFNNIKSLRLFQNVETNIETDQNNKTKNININVEERSTGEIFAGAGAGTSGSSLSFGISENNYLGEGIKLGSEFNITTKSITGELYLNEPNYRNSNRSFNRGFERSEIDNLDNFGYETEKTAFSFGTSYEQYKDIFFSPTLENSYEKINTNSKASAAKRKQDGNYLDIILDYDINLNKLNQNFNPSDGYNFIFSQELPIYSEDYTLVNRINYNKYYEIEGNAIFSFGVFGATANSLSNDDARITKRIFIPGRKLRGFEVGKIGPKDGNDFVGGNYGSAVNLASTLPNLFTEVQNLDLSLFLDAANIWGVDYDSTVKENKKIRSSTGIAVDWFTPIGPLSLSYSVPLSKNSSDVTETIRFNIGTTF